MSSAPALEEAPWKAGLRGARANVGPGLALQAVALVLVVSYYQIPSMRAALESLVEARSRLGVLFPIMTTAFCGGLFPYVVLKLSAKTRDRYTLAQGLAITAFWALKGLEIDTWYRVLAWLLGSGQSVGTVAGKMFLDQFVYCPLWAIPVTAVIYGGVESHFDWGAVWRDIRSPRWYRRRTLPILLSNLGIWVPTVCLIYALPTALQLPLQNVVLCFFTLIIAHVTARR